MEEVDVVIVGSGFGGSIPALRLAEAGMKIVVLERGGRLSYEDLQQSDDPDYLQTVTDYVIGSSNIGFRTGKMVGGASVNMDGAFFRTPSESFLQKDDAGRTYWPEALSRAELDKYYPTVEQMLKVRQMTWNEISKGGGLFAKMCDAAGVSVNLSLMNYTDCVQCGFCAQGCVFEKKMNLLYNYIPQAERKSAEFRSGKAVDTIATQGTGYVVSYRDVASNTPAQIYAERVIVAGGGIHTPALLLRSKAGLAGLSSHVGQHFNTNGEHTYIGILPSDFDDLQNYDIWKGMDNAGLMSFHFWQSDLFTMHPGGGFEPSVMAANLAAPADWSDPRGLPARAWGMEYKRFTEAVYRHRVIAFSVLGVSAPHLAVTLKADGSPDVVLADRIAHDAYLSRMDARVQAMAAPTGVLLLDAIDRRYSGMTSAHLLGSCRMADRVEDGVVDSNGQVFGHPNLYVTDASTVPYALGVNPSLTISALAERAAAHIAARG